MLQIGLDGDCRGYGCFSCALDAWIRRPEFVREVIGGQFQLQRLRVAQEGLGSIHSASERKELKWASSAF